MRGLRLSECPTPTHQLAVSTSDIKTLTSGLSPACRKFQPRIWLAGIQFIAVSACGDFLARAVTPILNVICSSHLQPALLQVPLPLV